MSTEKVRRKKIKKWIFPSEGTQKALVVFAGRAGRDTKIIFKAPEKGANSHLTAMMKEDGSIDFHETKEGKIKSYTPLLRGTLAYQEFVEDFMSILLEQLKTPIDLKDEIYRECIVLIPKSKEKLTEFYERFYTKGEKMIIPDKKGKEKIAESMEDYFITDYLPEMRKYAFSLAFVVDPKEENIEYLVNVKDYYFLVGMKEKEFDKIFKRSFRIEWLKREVQESTR